MGEPKNLVPRVDEDKENASTEDRWSAYKRSCREAGREPMTWGKWLNAGMPLGEES